jgi:hypothetical protein
MTRSRFHIVACAGVLAVGVALAMITHVEQQPPFLKIRAATTLVLHEGLPHPNVEYELFANEQKKPCREIHGSAFYSELLSLSADDATRVSTLLGDAESYQPFREGKKCNGFHPDYAIEWTLAGKSYFILLCFGCGEAKVIGPGTELHYDLVDSARTTLREMLKKYRKNRPRNPASVFGGTLNYKEST